MSYEPKTVLLKLAQLCQKLKVSVSTYQSDMPNLIKYLIPAVNDIINILTRNLPDHPYFITAPLDHLDIDERATTVFATHRDSINKLLVSTASSTFPVFTHQNIIMYHHPSL